MSSNSLMAKKNFNHSYGLKPNPEINQPVNDECLIGTGAALCQVLMNSESHFISEKDES